MSRELGKLDARCSVMRLDELNSFLLVECEPLLRIGRNVWIVVLHGRPQWRLDKNGGRTGNAS